MLVKMARQQQIRKARGKLAYEAANNQNVRFRLSIRRSVAIHEVQQRALAQPVDFGSACVNRCSFVVHRR
jgi:hypothetical protein